MSDGRVATAPNVRWVGGTLHQMSDGSIALSKSLLLLQKFTLLKLDCSELGLIDTYQPQKLPKWYMLPPHTPPPPHTPSLPPTHTPVCHCVLVHSLVGRQEAEVVGTHLNPAQHSRTHSAHEGTSHLTEWHSTTDRAYGTPDVPCLASLGAAPSALGCAAAAGDGGWGG